MKQVTTTHDLFKEICDCLEVDLLQAKSQDRNIELKTARHYYCYFGNVYFGFTLKQLGGYLGKRHHTTIINGRQFVSDGIDTNNQCIVNSVVKIKSQLGIEDKEDERIKLLNRKLKESNSKNRNLKVKSEMVKRENQRLKKENTVLQVKLNSKYEIA